MRVVWLLPLLVGLAACGEDGPSPEEKQRMDDADVAAVKAAQVPPPTPVTPDKILYPDIEKYELFGAGCNFAPEGSMAAIALAQQGKAFMKIDGELEAFVADAGSGDLPLGTKGKYTSSAWSFTLDLASQEGKQEGVETTTYPARFVLRNARDQIAYEAGGVAQCGS